MAAATLEPSIQGNICDSPLKMMNTQSTLDTTETPQLTSTQSNENHPSQPGQESPEEADQTAGASSAEEHETDKSSQDTTPNTAENTQPDKSSQGSTPQVSGDGGADSDSDDEPVSRSRPRARRLALDSDEEAEDSPADVRDGPTDQAAAEEADSDGDEKMDASPAPVRSRVRRLALDSDDDEDGGDEGKTSGASETSKKNSKPAAKAGTDGEDSEDEEKKRKERNMRRLMALGDSSSEDERPRPQSPTMDVDDEDQTETTKSESKKKPQKKKAERRKVEQEAAEQMRQIRSASQRRTRESRLNLPYHRPRQRTLHEFLARRQKAPALPDHPRVSGADADYITRRLEEKEKEIEEFYKSESEHGDSAGSDPEWAPGATPTEATKPQSQGDPDAAHTTAATTAPTTAAAPAAEEAKEDDEEEKVMSQSSQKVQEWLEGVQPVGDDAVVPPMTDVASVGQPEPTARGEKTAANVSEVMDTEETAKAADTVTETGPVEKAATETAETVVEGTGEKTASETAPAAVDERPAEETRSVSADTETTSLAPGDSASVVNNRASADVATDVTADPAPAAAAPAPAPPAARLAKLAARLPQLGAVLNTTPRLQKRSEVVTLDDSDEEETGPEQSDLDKFVERFVRHSNAKPKKAEKKTVNISLVRYESDAAGGKQLVADSVPVTVTSGDPSEPADGPPGAQRQQLQKALLSSIRKQREEARQRREREYKLYNSEQVDDGYLDDLPDEEAEPSDLSSESGESEPEEEPPLTETPRKRCPLVDDEAEQEDDDDGDGGGDGEEKEEKDGEDDELKLVLEDDEDLLDSPPRRTSVTTEPELFSTQPSGGHANAAETASQADSQDSDRASSSLVTAHQPGGGFRFGGNRRDLEEEGRGHDELPLTPAPDTQPVCGTGSFSLPPEDTQQVMAAHAAATAAAETEEDIPDSLSMLGPLRLTPEPRAAAGRGPRSAIGALIDPAADESMDDLMSLCSGKFDAPGTGKLAKVARADTQPVDLLSVPLPSNKDGVMTWSAATASQKRTERNPSSEPLRGMSLMSTVDMFEDGNANMPLDIISDDEDEAPATQPVKQKKRRRRLVFSDDEGSEADEPVQHDSVSEEEDGEDGDEDSVQPARPEDASLPTDFTGFLGGGDKKKFRAEFFDAEAELSGSDEPSEDEADGDELDDMEQEEADAEHIDEHKLREQVERIHQKKALDEDIREMKLFQERFLEDGDLHGRGRERKFRWSNADDAADDSNERRPSDDEADPADDERDEKWRLERHEREKWLQEHAQKDKDEDEPETEGFTFLKPGQKAVRRLMSGGQRSSEGATAAAAPAAAARSATLPPPLPVSPRAVKVSRGSFLRRGKEALARLVTTARSLSMPAGTSSKNSSNRTFSMGKKQQSESEPDPEVELQFQQAVEEKTTKRKAPSTPATDAKRAKLSRSFSSLAEDSQSSSLFSVIL